MKIWQVIKRLPFVTPIFRSLHPIESTCGICGLPWSSCRPSHTVDMVECTDEHCGTGFFPVCEYCWQHRKWEDIKGAITELYLFWYNEGCNPYTLHDMLSKAESDYLKHKENV